MTLRIDDLLLGRKDISGTLLDELEEVLITADISVNTANKLIGAVQANINRGEADRPELIRHHLKEAMYAILRSAEHPSAASSAAHPLIVMVTGVNGTGKTITIAKMAHYYATRGKRVLLAAADTFRAAAIEQLAIWSTRIGCDVVSQTPGSDPSALAHDAVNAALKRNSDVLIIDTAGTHARAIRIIVSLPFLVFKAPRRIPKAPSRAILRRSGPTPRAAGSP